MLNPYKKEIIKFVDGVPAGLEIVNLGSTFSKFGFDYKYFNKKGFNFAVQPQPLAYDYSILKKYYRNLKKGAIVVVVVCLFGFTVEYYRSDRANYKYYYFLDNNEIHRYSKIKEFIVRFLPWITVFGSLDTIRKIKNKFIGTCSIKRVATRHKDPRINSWMCEFNLENTVDPDQSQKFEPVFKKTVESLRKILEICKDNEFKPLIINMPAIKAQSNEFSNEFIEIFYTANIKLANLCDAPVIDYFRDERFDDSSLYENGVDCLNDKGRKYFSEILISDLKRFGLWEDLL